MQIGIFVYIEIVYSSLLSMSGREASSKSSIVSRTPPLSLSLSLFFLLLFTLLSYCSHFYIPATACSSHTNTEPVSLEPIYISRRHVSYSGVVSCSYPFHCSVYALKTLLARTYGMSHYFEVNSSFHNPLE